MGQAYEAIIDQGETSDLLSTGEVAKLLGVSRQHVVDLCDRGDLPYVMVGSHRRIRRADAERARQVRTKMTRDQRRSLWLAYAVAGRIVMDPDSTIRRARNELLHLESRSNRWTREWQHLLDGEIDDLLRALTSSSQRSRELRQNTPFGHTLTAEERAQVLLTFSSSRKTDAQD
jgi:excisionase family DNA binding protein